MSNVGEVYYNEADNTFVIKLTNGDVKNVLLGIATQQDGAKETWQTITDNIVKISNQVNENFG